jgi:Glycosyltransferase
VSEKERILNKILNDKSRPVEFKDSYGGSENQLRLLFKNVDDEYFKDVNLILNSTDPKLLEKNKINILWMQHYVNQKETENLKNNEYINKLNYIVFNSNWNFENFKIQYKIPENKSIVLKNAINKIDFKNKTKDKISLIYHTTPWRGLELLLKIFKKINKENVELNVCSSTIIYGKKFHDSYEKKFQKLFDDCKNTKNVNFHGYKSNSSILEMLKEVHIFSYPSIWTETSCIAAIEAMAAGCEVVYTNLWSS